MSDIVERLREGTTGTDVAKTDVFLNGLMREAADEIQRLRNAVAYVQRIAEAADLRASSGRTLRDWFAGQALAGLLANCRVLDNSQLYADDAYCLADAMLAARERPADE